MKIKYIIFAIAMGLMTSCGQTQRGNDGGDTIPMSYAHNLMMVEHEDYTMVELRNPWDTTKVLHRYALVEMNSTSDNPQKNIPSDADIIRVPLTHSAVFTSVMCGLMIDLGVENAIAGVCDAEYISAPYVNERLKNGSIKDLGNGMAPTLESVMELMPDALMPSPFQNSGGYGRLERIGIPIVECADYMEISPLARAEWMKFYGRLFGVGERADSLFREISHRYESLKTEALNVEHRPRLMVEQMSGGVWYQPNGESTMGQMYKDAGADYVWAETPGAGSQPMSIEAVMDRALDADIWLLKYTADQPLTYGQMQSDNPLYAHFRPFKERNVWACNTVATHFYEETPFHPDILLEALIKIFHGKLGSQENNSYFCRVKE